MGRVEIRVCAARNLADTQVISKPDPYVVVKFHQRKKKMKFKTQVVDNNLNPVWNELFKFQTADEFHDQVEFQVWNDNVLRDERMGTYTLSLSSLRKGVVEDFWCILNGAKNSCELHLRVLAVDFGRPPPEDHEPVHSIEDDKIEMPSDQKFKKNGGPSHIQGSAQSIALAHSQAPAQPYSQQMAPPPAASYPPQQQQQPGYGQPPAGYAQPPPPAPYQQPGYYPPPQQPGYGQPAYQRPAPAPYPPQQQPGYYPPPQQPGYQRPSEVQYAQGIPPV